jgi:hypothetical protein
MAAFWADAVDLERRRLVVIYPHSALHKKT